MSDVKHKIGGIIRHFGTYRIVYWGYRHYNVERIMDDFWVYHARFQSLSAAEDYLNIRLQTKVEMVW